MKNSEKKDRVANLAARLLPPSTNEGLESLGDSQQMNAWVERAAYAKAEEKDQARSALRKLARSEELAPPEVDALEAIVLPEGRPALDVIDGSFRQPPDPWTHLASPATKRLIETAIPAIGRIEIPAHPLIPYAGTGFVVGDDLLMTNRHVAELFVRGLGLRDLRFRTGLESVDVDFKRERASAGSQPFHVRQVVMVHPHWDMALLRVEGLAAPQRTPMLEPLAPEDLQGREVVIVGYPAFDPRNPKELQDRIFGQHYQIKRLQPGRVVGVRDTVSFSHPVRALAHDSSTLGGNSGSAVISVATGRIVGLHFGGAYLQANFAVPSYELARDARVVDAGVAFSASLSTTSGAPSWLSAWGNVEAPSPTPSVAPAFSPRAVEHATVSAPPVSFTIPLNITVTISAATGAVSSHVEHEALVSPKATGVVATNGAGRTHTG